MKAMRPGSEAELAEAVRAATGPLAVRGGGTRGCSLAGEVLETGGLSGIKLYEPGALTLVAGAGTPVVEIETALAGEGQRLAFEPMDHRGLLGTDGEPTIGGVMAANVSGPRRVQVGAARDFALGVRFVDGTGQVVKNGGRVMKNVTGYDLVKLMCGSRGSLGVLTEVSLKVLPAPETEATLVMRRLGTGDAVRAMASALGSPFEVTGAAFGPVPSDAAALCLRLEGFADSVDYRAGELRRRLGEFGEAELVEAEASREIWRDIRDVTVFRDAPVVVRVSLKPSDAPDLLRAVDGSALLDWGGGLVWVAGEGDLLSPLRAVCAEKGGHATLVKAPAEMCEGVAMFQPEAAPVAALTRGLRQRFDPRGILNPGLMG